MREYYTYKTYKDTDLAYLAGIIDGEGSITIGSYAKTSAGNPAYNNSIVVTNTDEVLIDWLCDVFGSRKMKRSPSQHPKGMLKQVFMWQITGNRLKAVCEQVHQFSVIKKEQIRIMLEFIETKQTQYYVTGQKGRIVPDHVHVRRRELILELRALHNRRGTLIHD